MVQNHLYLSATYYIATTTFAPFTADDTSAVYLGGPLAGCEQYPCPLGQGCTYASYSLSCAPCSSTMVGLQQQSNRNGSIACTMCEAGTGPNSKSTACIACTNDTYSAFGVCQPCNQPSVYSSTTCSLCEAGKGPNINRTACKPCLGNTFSTVGQCRSCDAGSTTNADRTACVDFGAGTTITNGDTSALEEILNSSSTLLPQVKLEIQVSGAAMVTGSAEQATLIQVLMQEMAAALGVAIADIQISNIRPASGGSGRRRLQTTVAADFDLIILSPTNAASILGNLTQQMQVPSSALMSSSISGSLNPNVTATIVFICPTGMMRPIGGVATDCTACDDDGKVTNLKQTGCVSCPAGTSPSADRSACKNCTGTTSSLFGIECQNCTYPSVVDAQRTSCLPCSAGSGPSLGRASCEPCSKDTYSAFGVCQPCNHPSVYSSTTCSLCEAGKGPNINRTACKPCSKETFSPFGQCQPCQSPNLASVDGTKCDPCPRGEVPHRGVCVCDKERYDSRFGLLFCFDQEYHPDSLALTENEVTRVELAQGQRCLPCPEGCVECRGSGAMPVPMPGYSLSPTALTIWTAGLEVNTSRFGDEGTRTAVAVPRQLPRSLFRCPVDGAVCAGDRSTHSSQPTPTPSAFNASNTRRQLSVGLTTVSVQQCAPGHEGVLCGTCEAGWQGGFNKMCAVCLGGTSGGAGVAALAVGGAMAAAVVVVLVLRWWKKKAAEQQLRVDDVRKRYAMARKAWSQARRISADLDEHMDDEEEGGAFRSLLETLKIVVGNLQIIAQLPVTLKFTCAACDYFQAVMKTLSVVNLDVLSAFSVGCMAPVNLYTRFFFIVSLPVALILLVQLEARVAHCSASKVHPADEPSKTEEKMLATEQDAATTASKKHPLAAANELCMLIIFLAYPTVSSTVFTMFACRELDFGESWHVYDTSIDCRSSEYLLVRSIAMVLVVLMPIGVPVFFGFLLYKNRATLSVDERDEVSFDELAFVRIFRIVSPDSGMSKSSLQRLFCDIDTDKSGKLSLDEVWKFALKDTAVEQSASDDIKAVEVRPLLRPTASVKHSYGLVAAPPGTRSTPVAHTQPPPARSHWWSADKEDLQFLVRAFEPRFYWFGLVEYLKKFLLAGILVFMEPGSTAQLYVGISLSFLFFACVARTMPYQVAKTDRVAIVAEANLFFTMLCLLMVKVNLAGEFLDAGFYDAALSSSVIATAVIPIGIVAILGVRRLVQELLDSSKEPPEKGDLVRILEYPDDPRCRLRTARVESVPFPFAADPTVTVTVFDVEVPPVQANQKWRAQARLLNKSARSVADQIMAKQAEASHTHKLTPWCKKRKIQTLCISLKRSQMQRLVDKKHILKLCAGIGTQVFKCVRAIRKKFMGGDDKKEPEDDTVDLETLKNMTVARLGKALTPLLQKFGLAWKEVEPAVLTITELSELHTALADPPAFLKLLLSAAGPLAKQMALSKIQPLVEPLLEPHGLTWTAALPAINAIDSIEELQEALDHPEELLKRLMVSAAKLFAIAKLRAALEPKLKAKGLAWADALPAIELVSTVEELQAALGDTEAFVHRLLSSAGAAGKHLAIAKLRPRIEPLAQMQGVSWGDMLSVLECVDTMEELQAALADPEALLASMAASLGPAAKAFAIAKLRAALEPKLRAKGLAWADALPAIELVSTVEELQAALSDPRVFLDGLLPLLEIADTTEELRANTLSKYDDDDETRPAEGL